MQSAVFILLSSFHKNNYLRRKINILHNEKMKNENKWNLRSTLRRESILNNGLRFFFDNHIFVHDLFFHYLLAITLGN